MKNGKGVTKTIYDNLMISKLEVGKYDQFDRIIKQAHYSHTYDKTYY